MHLPLEQSSWTRHVPPKLWTRQVPAVQTLLVQPAAVVQVPEPGQALAQIEPPMPVDLQMAETAAQSGADAHWP